MAQSNKFKLIKVSEISENEYLVTFLLNERKYKVSAKVECEEPIFGVNFPDEFTLASREFPTQTIPKIVEEIKSFHNYLKASKDLQAA